MSVDVHSALPPGAAHGASTSVDGQLDTELEVSWAETVLTIAATTVAVLFVSLVAAMMAMA